MQKKECLITLPVKSGIAWVHSDCKLSVGVGQRKMVKLFEQVFNRTIYQFGQKAKIIGICYIHRNALCQSWGIWWVIITWRTIKKYYKEYLKNVLANKINNWNSIIGTKIWIQ